MRVCVCVFAVAQTHVYALSLYARITYSLNEWYDVFIRVLSSIFSLRSKHSDRCVRAVRGQPTNQQCQQINIGL